MNTLQDSQNFRENEQKFTEARDAATTAISELTAQGKLAEAAEAHAQEILALRQLIKRETDPIRKQQYIEAMRITGEQGIEKGRKSGDPAGATVVLFEDGKARYAQKDYDVARDELVEAASSPLPEKHDRPAYRKVMQSRAAIAEAQLADSDDARSTFIKQAETLAEEIYNDAQEDAYNKDTWAVGTYQNLAELPGVSQEQITKYNQRAQQIMQTNPTGLPLMQPESKS